MGKMNRRVTWDRMKWRKNVTCRVCGAKRDYIEKTKDGFKCTLCGNVWLSVDRDLVIVND